MSLKIPNNTKKYLIECLNKHNNSNIDFYSTKILKESRWDKLFGKNKPNMKDFLDKNPEQTGGFGEVDPKDPEEGTGEFNFDDIGDFITDLGAGGVMGIVGGAAGSGAISSAKARASSLAKKIGTTIGKIGILGTPFMINPLAMAAKLSGGDWVRENLKGIALGQEGLVAQGAGSPWVPLRTSGLGILSKDKPNSKKSTP